MDGVTLGLGVLELWVGRKQLPRPFMPLPINLCVLLPPDPPDQLCLHGS